MEHENPPDSQPQQADDLPLAGFIKTARAAEILGCSPNNVLEMIHTGAFDEPGRVNVRKRQPRITSGRRGRRKGKACYFVRESVVRALVVDFVAPKTKTA